MRILALTTTMDRPEAGIFAGLAKRGASISIIGDPAPEHAKLLTDAGVAIEHYTFSSRFDREGMNRIRAHLRANKPDLVYALTNRTLSTLICTRISKNIPIIAYRGTVGHLSWFDPTSWLTYLNPRVTKILCVSQAVRDYLRSLRISPDKLETVYKGHDISWYSQKTLTSRSDLGIPDSAFVVGCTAVMRRVKGVDDLIEAAGTALKQIPNLHLLLVGTIKDPAIEVALKNFPDRSRIHLTGFRTDAASLGQLMDVTVMASKSREGFPKSVIEAMAQGIPPVVTAVGGMPELVGGGEAGLLVPPCNPTRLADALVKLFSDNKLRKELGEMARSRIENVFSLESSITITYTIFEQVATKNT
jgi:glycosyltransferase involved in cell wall biosynthesis